ncbi:SMI1/KNR4 family protein [Hymenobacter properus]|uniref:SMI1/KNR4 family protein n=1 Tax=Hymenobacter properus TaxID=2791026 RepID=A0A931FP95_9BACT|nr:SMI1/KNR4 family protein [Hymenobacter properus]MBF9143399.1 SMI1/KNR4 family protein [Hymenobacter properus]MBR7722212.1 hypothetical protein [Microvirga sp. SRT04]
MENKLIRQLEAVMLAGVAVPLPIKQLYEWIEANGFYIDNDGGRIGFLYPEQDLQESWTDEGRRGGTNIEFAASGNANLKYWFGAEHEEVNRRVCVFGKTGGEGSECAFWMSDTGELKIVHMGSGSGSVLNCVLADNAVDFLRLLAIGYDEICWSEEFVAPPNELNEDFKVEPNVEFQEWVRSTFKVEIPKMALEIVRHPSDMGDEDSEDEFCRWCQQFIA